MHGVRRSSVDHGRSHSGSRKGSLVEAAEKHLDKNTIILIVNVFILMILMSLLYMVATSAMAGTSATGAGSSKDEH